MERGSLGENGERKRNAKEKLTGVLSDVLGKINLSGKDGNER